MKYKVIVQPLDESEPKVPQEFQDGVLCNGFTIIAGDNVISYDTNIMELAAIIASKNVLLSAAVLAKALYDAKKLSDRASEDGSISFTVKPMDK